MGQSASYRMALSKIVDWFRVEAPVARRSPHRPGLEDFPHPVPRFRFFYQTINHSLGIEIRRAHEKVNSFLSFRRFQLRGK
jgi:hypothetical protein